MFIFGFVSALAFAVVGAMSWWLLRHRPLALGSSIGVIVGALWLTSVTTTWMLRTPSGHRAGSPVSGVALAWPVAPESPLVTAAAERPTGSVQAASVESLVGGLEARLAANPNDAEGWALLAQSYAYTANEEAVARAMQRAIELGVDEAALRERIERAKRSVHPVDWVGGASAAPGR